MSAVTVNSRTYSDDSNPVTGLGNGGHRTRLIPLFSDALTEISNQVQIAAQAYRATSTSTVAIGAGSKSFVVAAGKGFFVGDLVVARQATNASNFMAGAITAFNPTTGVLTLSVSPGDFGGSGAISDWVLLGPIGPRGLRGLAGFSYGWDASTAAGDPGAGLMRANNAALASATALYLDSLDGLGVDVSTPLTIWGASTSAVKGRLILRSQSDPSQQIVYDVTAVTGAAGHVTLTVVYRGGAASFAAGVAVDAVFSRTGDKGDVLNPGQQFQFDAATAAADPGSGKIRFNNAALSSATAAYVDVVDVNGSDVSAWLATLGAGLNLQKGVLRLQSMTTLTKFVEFGVTAAANSTGYFTLSLTYLSPTPAPVFTAGEALALLWSRAGDKGETGAAGTVSSAGDGSVTAPGLAFASETGLGLRRKGAALAAVAAGGADLLELRVASQAEAEAGTNTLALMSPQRVLQSIRRNAIGNPGGQTVTGDVILTTTSPGAILANPSAPGFFATLPAANALPAAGRGLFSIYNAGDFDYGIRDNSGTRLGWIPPRGSAVIDAVNIGTAAGTWNCIGAEKLGVTAQFANASAEISGGLSVQTIDMGSDRTLFLVAGSFLYALVYDGATRSWGNLTLIFAGVATGQFAGVRTAAGTQAMVCFGDGSALRTVVLTIATTSVTVNTAVMTTLPNSLAAVWQMIAVGSSFVLSYSRTGGNGSMIRAITIAGVTPTIGAEVIVFAPGTFTPRLYAAGSILRVVICTSSTVEAKPYTVSGATLTAGAAASVTAANENAITLQNSNGNILAIYNQAGSGPAVTVFKLTGTAEAAATVGPLYSTGYVFGNTDVMDLGGGKLLVASMSGTQFAVNIVTDTAGTPSAGTGLTYTNLGNLSQVVCLQAIGGVARVALKRYFGESQAWVTQYNFNVAGASPSLAAISQLQDVDANLPASCDLFGRRRPHLMRAGAAAYVPPQYGSVFAAQSLMLTANAVVTLARPTAGVREGAAPGFSEFQSWFAGLWSGGSFGVVINQLECAA